MNLCNNVNTVDGHEQLLKQYRDAYPGMVQAVTDNMERLYGFTKGKAREIARHTHLGIECAKAEIAYEPINIHKLSERQIRRRNNKLMRLCSRARGRQVSRSASTGHTVTRLVAMVRSFGRTVRSISRSAFVRASGESSSGGDDGGSDSTGSDSDPPRPGPCRAAHSLNSSPKKKKSRFLNHRRIGRLSHMSCNMGIAGRCQ